MYKVLNNENEVIIVETINPNIHRHTSWREFTDNDACIKLKEEIKEKHNLSEQNFNDLSESTLKNMYKTKYWRYPSSKMKLENIIAKL